MVCRCFMVFEANGGILPIFKAITCKSKIASASFHPFGKVERHLGCVSGNATRARWKNRTPGTTSSLSASFQTHVWGRRTLKEDAMVEEGDPASSIS